MGSSSFLLRGYVRFHECRVHSGHHLPTQKVAAVRSLFISYVRHDTDLVCRAFAMAAAMFMNSNSLPIAMMQSLVFTVPGLKFDDTDNKNDMLGRALTYLMLYSTLGMVVCLAPLW